MSVSNKSGIYCIERIETRQKYIGKGKNVIKEMNRSHKGCTYIYNAINFYGKDAFSRYVIEYCEIDKLVEREQYYIKKWNTRAPNGYNLTDGGDGSLGRIWTPESIEKISATKKGKHPSSQARENMSKAGKGKKQPAGTGEKISRSNKGRIVSPRTRELISIALSGNKNPNHGTHRSEETKAKQSIAMSGKNNPNYGKTPSKETIEKALISRAWYKQSDETKEKIGNANRGENNGMYGVTGEENYWFGKKRGKTSNYFGISRKFQKYKDKIYIYWMARVLVNRKVIQIGMRNNELTAALLYDKYIRDHNLPNPLNFPDEKE